MEIWGDIPGFEGEFQVSQIGRVKHIKNGRESILKPRKNKSGYLQVNLQGKNYYLHRLVALVFVPNPHNKPEVNHIDENKAHNDMYNLEWVTREENNNWGTRNERAANTRKNNKKLSEAMKIRWQDEEYRKKMCEARRGEKNGMYGKQFSEEHRKKISAAKRGKGKSVIAINIITNEIIQFANVQEAEKNGYSISCIRACCKNKYNGNSNVYRNYKWFYLDEEVNKDK